ncbi:ATP-dependent permease [Rhodotorula kratochvilovae]
MATYPPSSPATPPRSRIASPQASPYLHPSPPRTSSLHNRSPRLGQSSFDASLAPSDPPQPPSYTASPRVLFPKPRSSPMQPAASVETLHIMSSGVDAAKEPVQWELRDDEPEGRRRPPNLDLSNSNAALPHLRYSTTSAVSQTGSDSSSPAAPANGPKKPVIRPSFRLLFSLTTRRTFWTVIFPAVLCGVVSGLVPPFMTQMLGDAMQSFTDYATAIAPVDASSEVISAAKTKLLHAMRDTAIKLTVAAAVIFSASTTNIALWVVHGERVAHALRLKVYNGISSKGIEWFDRGMGGAVGEEGVEEGKSDAASLMGRFTKDTDDARLACSQTIGLVLQYSSATLFCLILAFYRDWRVAFVVLATIPVVTFAVAFTERYAGPLANENRDTTSRLASRVDRIIGAMPTVKAFNAEDYELKGFKVISKNDFTAYIKLHFVWGVRSGITSFLLMAMFVQGFWYGAHLIRTGQSTAAAVNTCFWACMLGSSYLQTAIPLLVTIEKGKIAMAGLLALARDDPAPVATLARATPPPSASSGTIRRLAGRRQHRKRGSADSATSDEKRAVVLASDVKDPIGSPLSPHPFNLASPTTAAGAAHTPVLIPLAGAGTLPRRRGAAPRAMGKLRPATFSGELSLRGVSFHYPTRPAPAAPALDNVSLYFAARETTYVVGTSGSGKSTVGQLLLGLYQPEAGHVEVDEQGLEWIDDEWLRGHVACVSQGASVLFDGTIHDNVAVGVVGQLQEDGSRRRREDVTREEVIAACRGALIHDFIRDLPEGYDTWLSGEKGASLSGGQRQRLAIARAWLRDPTVLILDEATSALDATSRLLVNEAVKRWRDNRTTIIITHDLAPIGPDDFVYVMADGRVVEQGYRADLEADADGPFATLSATQQGPAQARSSPFLGATEFDDDDEAEILDDDSDLEGPVAPYSVQGTPRTPPRTTQPPSPMSTPRIQISDADADADAGGHKRFSSPGGAAGFLFGGVGTDSAVRASRELRDARRVSATFSLGGSGARSRSPSPASRPASRGELLPAFDPTAPASDASSSRSMKTLSRTDSEMSLKALEIVGAAAMQSRRTGRASGATRIKHRTLTEDELRRWADRSTTDARTVVQMGDGDDDEPLKPMMGLGALLKRYWPTIPNKLLFVVGMVMSVVVGALTPLFSTFLSQVMSNLGNPNGGKIITTAAIVILVIAFAEGALTFLKFYLLERCAMGWCTAMRRRALGLVVKQDKAFFDEHENSTSSLSHCIVKDSEDARTLVGTIIGQLVVLVSMLLVGIVWSFATGWELTLVGFGLAPVLVIVVRAQTSVLNRLEQVNKVKRENVSKRFHQTIANIRPIRSMSIQSVFATTFEATALKAQSGGIKAAPFTGAGFASVFTLTYLTEALMLYVGAILVTSGRYTFSKMLQVFSIIIFTVTFASALMNYLPGMAKSLRAANDLLRLLDLTTETRESEGRMTFPIEGHVQFADVEFAYPSRADVPVLKGISFDIRPGECVGIVGASGSGKSTIASLLQRLYEPSGGSVLLDNRPLNRTDVRYLRSHVAVVSQHPALFDMTVAENIAYGRPEGVVLSDVVNAAKQAHIHEFIESLPRGYDTPLGENASLISGGQAQRLQIARALVGEPAREILILDECTSALDPANQKAVMDTLLKVKQGRTTLIVTHKLAVMEKCDRIVVVDNGVVAETGTIAELRSKPHGVFATLASGGEWEAS